MSSMGETKIRMTVCWMRKHKLLFMAATRHPFIHSIRDGTLPSSFFNNWLKQEYWLAKNAIVPFLSNILEKARRQPDDSTDAQLIQRGIRFRNGGEIPWLENKANENPHLSLTTGVDPLQPTKDLSTLLESLISAAEENNYSVEMAILWALESVYHDSFAHCLVDDNSHTPEDMKEVCRKWGNDAFGDYCVSLQSAADRALEKASPDAIAKAEITLLQFLEIVVELWNVNMKTVQPNTA